MPIHHANSAGRILSVLLTLFLGWNALCFTDYWWQANSGTDEKQAVADPAKIAAERRGVLVSWAISFLLAGGCVAAFVGTGKGLFRRTRPQWAQAVIDACPDAFFLTDPDMNIVFWNAGALSMFGYSNRELYRLPLSEVVPVPDETSASALQHPESIVQARVRALHRTGRRIPVDVTVRTQWLDHVTGFVVIAQPARAMSGNMEAGYREETRLLTDLFDSVPTVLVFFDPMGHITRMNREAQRILGWTAPELRGTPYWSFALNGAEVGKAQVEFEHVGDGELGPVTQSWKTASGRDIRIRWTRRVCRDEHGRIRGVIASGQPVGSMARVAA